MEITKLTTIEDIDIELADINDKIKKHIEIYELLVESKVVLKMLRKSKNETNKKN